MNFYKGQRVKFKHHPINSNIKINEWCFGTIYEYNENTRAGTIDRDDNECGTGCHIVEKGKSGWLFKLDSSSWDYQVTPLKLKGRWLE